MNSKCEAMVCLTVRNTSKTLKIEDFRLTIITLNSVAQDRVVQSGRGASGN